MRVLYDRLLTSAARARTSVANLGEARDLPSPYSSEETEYRTDSLEDAHNAKSELGAVCKEILELLNAELRSTRIARPFMVRGRTAKMLRKKETRG